MSTVKSKIVKKWVSLAVAVFLGILFVLNPWWMLEYRVRDARFQQPAMLHHDIVVVGIDERALSEFGPFGQWPRSLMAEAIHILNRYEDEKPSVIAIDILYSTEGESAEDDAALLEAVSSAGNVVMASRFLTGFDPQFRTTGLINIGIEKPYDIFLPYIKYGLSDMIFDRDGFVRSAILHRYFDNEIQYSFPVAAAAMYLGVDISQVHPFIASNEETFIRYSGLPGSPGQFFQFSFADIFEDDFEPWWWADTIIMIGPYATGMMEHHPVPIDYSVAMYNVEIHANILQQILEGNFARHIPAWANIGIIIAILALGMVLGELLDIRIVFGIFLVVGIISYFGTQWLFERGYVFPILTVPLALGIIFLYQLVYGYILQMLEKSRMRNVFKKYVDSNLVDNLIGNGNLDSDAVGQKKHIAVIFVDIRGFTTMTESLRDTPEVIVETLNEYLELTSSSVFNNGGSVDKFIGDATMALFNGFVPLDDYVYKAVKAAWDMVQGADSVNASIKERFGVDIGFGIGVHCGEAIVGNLGPSFRKDYTAIGEAVRTAASLESKALRSQVLISAEVYDILKGRVDAQPVDGTDSPEAFLLVEVKNLETAGS